MEKIKFDVHLFAFSLILGDLESWVCLFEDEEFRRLFYALYNYVFFQLRLPFDAEIKDIYVIQECEFAPPKE